MIECGLRHLTKRAVMDPNALRQLQPAYLIAARNAYPMIPTDWLAWANTATKEGPKRSGMLSGDKPEQKDGPTA